MCGRTDGSAEPGIIRARTYEDREAAGIQEYRCNCVQQWILYNWFLNAGLKKDQQQFVWGQCGRVNLDAYDKAREYAENIKDYSRQGLGIIFHSAMKGTGKSLLSALILKRAMSVGVQRGFFVTFDQMLSNFTSGWRDPEAEEWFSARVKNAGLLVIDDIGREGNGREGLAEKTFDLMLRHRISSGLPTIITTNYSKQEVEEGYGGNVFSLLTEASFFVEVLGVDDRKNTRNRAIKDKNDRIFPPLTVGWDL